jgi:hypothetical protein
MKAYRRSTAIEPFRKFCRALDLLILLNALRRRERLPGFSGLRRMTFLEMGPGPMRLAAFKRKLFRQVYFLDMADFGVPDPHLVLVNLESCGSVQAILECLPPEARSGPVLLFADHCLEHLSTKVVRGLFESIAEHGVAACFRVPNVHSPTGQRNYQADPTHRTPFDEEFRRDAERTGFAVFPWIRWYRPGIYGRTLRGSQPVMSLAEEIVLSHRPARDAGA